MKLNDWKEDARIYEDIDKAVMKKIQKQEQCEQCEGTGEWWCSFCENTRKILCCCNCFDTIKGVSHEVQCHDCKGEQKPCPDCNGTGKKEKG